MPPPTYAPAMSVVDVDAYLERIGLSANDVVTDLDGLSRLQRAHLATVPFENLDIVFGDGVEHDLGAALDKVVVRRRGGWCFEVNATFAILLDALGFDVVLLGAAVLLDGPSTLLTHVALEVSGGSDGIEPHLVDVGFGDTFDVPLALNRIGPQDGGPATFEFLASPQGTTLAEHVDGVPAARYRFKRVAHAFEDFAPVAASMQVDPDMHWSSKPFATRLIDPASSDRITLTTDRLKVRRGADTTETTVPADEWDPVLWEWFGIERPSGSDARG